MLTRLKDAIDVLRPRTAARTRAAVDAAGATLSQVQERLGQVQERLGQLQTTQGEVLSRIDALTRTVDEMRLGLGELRAVARRDAELDDSLDGLAALCDEARLTAHVRSAIAAAPLVLEPFPHAVIRDFLPKDFYAALIRGLPPVELFGSAADAKPQLTVPFSVGPIFSRRIWKYFVTDVVPRMMQEELVAKFRAPLEEWIAANWPALAANPLGPPVELQTAEGRILLRRRGYVIRPHRDPKWGFLTVIMYLARKGDNAEWGTQLYSVDEDRTARGAAPHWIDPAQCHRMVDVPFHRNTALALLNSWGAHGASIPPDAEPPDLERYIYQFRIGPSAESVRALCDMLSGEELAAWAGKLGTY
ncbi:MAG: hypothetical protein FJW14_09610 [Acidimicrobiia bacterium]|nr:hypothetical protein [Acidimicrobiia bacterium]